MILHDYWRSSAAYRVRIGLNLKGVAYRAVPHDLRTGEHRAPEFRALAPQALLPALEVDGVVLTQSLAILEWLDETHREPPLLPADAAGRAVVRAMAAVVASDIHPVNNLRIGSALKSRFGANQAAVDEWMRHWMTEGFSALETMVERHGGSFAFGDTPTLVDLCLVPQWYNAERYALDVAPYPRLHAAVVRARAIPAFTAAHPDRQPGAG